MKNIIKVIFDDNTELQLGEIKTKEQIKEDNNGFSDYRVELRYNVQFNEFQRSLLHEMNEDVIEEFAKDYLDLIHEDDCDCEDEKDICDFDDSEILSEAISRKIIPVRTDIVTMSLLDRMLKVLDVANQKELDSILQKLEQKHFLL